MNTKTVTIAIACILTPPALALVPTPDSVIEARPEFRLLPNGSVTTWFVTEPLVKTNREFPIATYTEKCKLVKSSTGGFFYLRNNRYVVDEDYDGFAADYPSRVLCEWKIDVKFFNYFLLGVRLSNGLLQYKGVRDYNFESTDNYNFVIDSFRKTLSQNKSVEIVKEKPGEIIQYILPPPSELVGVPVYLSELVRESLQITQQHEANYEAAEKERLKLREEIRKKHFFHNLREGGILLFLLVASLASIRWAIRNGFARRISNAFKKLFHRVTAIFRKKPIAYERPADELLKWSELRGKGDITQTEFEIQKKRILRNTGVAPPAMNKNL